MQKKFLLLVIVLTAALLLAACSGSGGGEDDPATSPGKALFAQTIIGTNPGCITCHSLEAGVTLVGPSMAGIGSRAGTAVAGQTAEEYLRTSILEPNAHLVEGFGEGLMPKTWGDNLSQEQIDQLIAYMLTLK